MKGKIPMRIALLAAAASGLLAGTVQARPLERADWSGAVPPPAARTKAAEVFSAESMAPAPQPQSYQIQSVGAGRERAAPQPIRYQVKAGDTLYRIAGYFGTTPERLIAANGISDPRLLQIGSVLRVPARPLDDKEPPLASSEVLNVLTATLTAYTAGVESTGKRPGDPEYGVTYSGVKAREGRTIAVDPRVIPLGAMVYIEGIGIRKAEDIGSAIKGARIDVFMSDVKQARDFGVKKNRRVYILSVPGSKRNM